MNANISRHLGSRAAEQPDFPAVKIPRGRTADGRIDYLSLSFAELDAEVDAWCARLTSRGVHRGDRTLVMVGPGLPLIASAFALFRLGAVPVIIDPGMGLRHFLRCVAHARPRALVGIPVARLASRIFFRAFRSVAVRVPASADLAARLPPAPKAAAAVSAPDDLAAILFTSGSTGRPKGVCYEHGMFEAQIRLIRETYGIQPGEVDLPLLPIFALFNPALGMTSIIPEIDPRRPAAADPAKIVQAIRQEQITNSFGSPMLWGKVARHCREKGEALPTLRRVLCAGAPVPTALWSAARGWMPNGRLHSPYGATEALPVSTVAEEQAVPGVGGAPIGRPVAGIAVKIIPLDDAPIGALGETRELPAGAIGEIIVQGPVVTRAYDGLPEATRRAKIPESGAPGAPLWHRMGDCGYFDAAGSLWFCGRAAERVETAAGTLHTEPAEQVFRAHPRAARCALIGLGERGRQIPALVAETSVAGAAEGAALAQELGRLGQAHPHTAAISRFYFRAKFPVDVRHNAKIHRLQLARWAARAQGFSLASP